MQYGDESARHQWYHLKEAMHMLLDRRHVSARDGEADVPERGYLMEQEGHDHHGEDERIDLEEETHQERDGDFGKHHKMENRLSPAGRVLDVACAMAEVVR